MGSNTSSQRGPTSNGNKGVLRINLLKPYNYLNLIEILETIQPGANYMF